jgi:hypothetical protein
MKAILRLILWLDLVFFLTTACKENPRPKADAADKTPKPEADKVMPK